MEYTMKPILFLLCLTMISTNLSADYNCYFYGCGSNSYCITDEDGKPRCRCDKGYRPRYNQSGCQYDTCGNGKVFLRFEGSTPVCTPGTYTVEKTPLRQDRIFRKFIKNRWLAGNHINHTPPSRNSSYKWIGDYISGTDLGISVQFKGETFVYFGDTHRPDGPFHPYCLEDAECNDAIAILNPYDTNPTDGISIKSVVTDPALPDRFHPVIIPGVHTYATSSVAKPGTFNVPSGATTMTIGNEKTLVLFYVSQLKENTRTSWVACSTDGITFNNCYQKFSYGYFLQYFPFSKNKFINISPVKLSADDFNQICSDDPGSILCDAAIDKNGGLLLFGAGNNTKKYRQSKLYLAYISQNNFGKLNSYNRPRVKYFDGAGWSNREIDAQPVINKAQFGELSVRLYKHSGEAYFVMLYNRGGVLYRTAHVSSPQEWSNGKYTKGGYGNPYYYNIFTRERVYGHYGYGPYIVDKYTKFDSDGLHLWHFLSSWEGPKSLSPYGVYSAETVIPWPPQ